MIYIDFGHHPDKERLPREAAIHGCIVITGLCGSAANSQDVPLPNYLKLNIHDLNFLETFKKLVVSIFENFSFLVQS